MLSKKKDTEPKIEQPVPSPVVPEVREPREIKEPRNIKTVNTVLGKGMRMDATLLAGEGIVQIEGEFHGEVDINGELILEKSGYVNGNIKTNVASISGNVTGNIKCSELLHVTQTGKVKGDIECKMILMDKGAIFIGYSKMEDNEPEPPVKPASESRRSIAELESFIKEDTDDAEDANGTGQ